MQILKMSQNGIWLKNISPYVGIFLLSIDISDFCSMMHILGTKGFYVVRLILSDTAIL